MKLRDTSAPAMTIKKFPLEPSDGREQVRTAPVSQLLEQVTRAVYNGEGRRALHPGQWAVLRFLDGAGRHGTVGDVASYLQVTHAPASRAVAALVRKAYVGMSTDPVDRRVHRLTLTEAGRALLAHDPTWRLEYVVRSLPLESRENFVRSLGLILEDLSERQLSVR